MLHPKQLKQYAAQCLAELFGTFILVFIGNLAMAQAKFDAKLRDLPIHDGLGVHLSYATGIYVALMVAGPISGETRKELHR